MTGMSFYYASRAVIAVLFAALQAFMGTPWWLALLIGVLVFGYFIWAPRSGRYVVHPELGVTALRRDERTQTINDRAARNAFVVTMLALAALMLYFGRIAPASVPVVLLQFLLVLGVLVYLLSDALGRRQS